MLVSGTKNYSDHFNDFWAPKLTHLSVSGPKIFFSIIRAHRKIKRNNINMTFIMNEFNRNIKVQLNRYYLNTEADFMGQFMG